MGQRDVTNRDIGSGPLRHGGEDKFAFRVQRRNRTDRNPAWPGIGSTDSSADRLPLSGSQRINLRWKAQSLRFPRPKAQEAARSFWTSAYRRALVFVRLLSQPLFGLRRQRPIIRTYVRSGWFVRPVLVREPSIGPLTVNSPARPAGIGIHSLRRTAFHDAIRTGATMREVREFAGHADIGTTEVYFVRRDEDAEVAARCIRIRVTGPKPRPTAPATAEGKPH
jgi:hypothetical protein